MSLKDGRILVAKVFQDFSSVNLTTTYTKVISNLSANSKGVYIENTSGTPVSIAIGASAGAAVEVDVSPINNAVEKALILNKTMDVYVKSLGGTLSTGKLLICIYN